MKERLDILMVNRQLAKSREKAKALIQSGKVYVNHKKIEKAGTAFEEDAVIEVRGETLRYVSRGGLKLEKAMIQFEIDLKEKVCVDIGASTGGFTDCMLQNGAKKVYAIDVGYDQLDKTLRENKRVINMEKTNIRYLKPEQIGESIDFASADVSFISLTKILPTVRTLLSTHGKMVCLIKPQFEAGRENVGKKGVVKDKKVHKEVLQSILRFSLEQGFSVLNLDYSPIKGPEGNIEYLVYLEKDENPKKEDSVDFQKTVEAAHGNADK